MQVSFFVALCVRLHISQQKKEVLVRDHIERKRRTTRGWREISVTQADGKNKQVSKGLCLCVCTAKRVDLLAFRLLGRERAYQTKSETEAKFLTNRRIVGSNQPDISCLILLYAIQVGNVRLTPSLQ